MGPGMSCFEWSNLAAGYLDGSLAPGLKRQADEHLAGCRECSERHQHFRLVLESLRSLPRTAAPGDLQHELEAARSRILVSPALLKEAPALLKKALRTPRTLSIALAAAAGLFILAALPRIRSVYEERVQRRLEASDFAELPLSGRGEDSEHAAADDFSSEGIEGDEGAAAGELVEASLGTAGAGKVSAAPQIWRFNLRTDSPQEIRAKVHASLVDAGALPGSRFLNGFAAPGGIQFDALVPQEGVERLKDRLEALVDPKESADAGRGRSDPAQDPYPTSPFTWFRSKSARPLPAGTVRVIVWISLT